MPRIRPGVLGQGPGQLRERGRRSVQREPAAVVVYHENAHRNSLRGNGESEGSMGLSLEDAHPPVTATGDAVPESIRGSIRATQEATVSASLGAELSHTG